MVGAIIGLTIGVAAILLGVKGFTREGIPFTAKTKITGTPAIVIGVVCVLIGLVFAWVGAVTLLAVSSRH